MLHSKPKVCVVLPTYNEVKNVPIIIPAIFEQTDKIDSHELHVLIVDDNSPDGTQDRVRELMGKFPNLHMLTGEKKGLGEAYKKGFDYVINTLKSDMVFEMDADLQHDPKLIPLFISLTHHGFNMIIGSRFVSGGSTPNFSLKRKAMSLFGNWMIKFFGGIPNIQDCTSGYRCIKVDLIKKCDLSFLSTRGYSFQSSLLCELIRNGARVVEFPIVFPDRQHGQSKLSFLDKVEFIINIPRIRFNRARVFATFCMVGASGVIVNMGLFILLTRLVGAPIALASPIAIELSILSNFLLNNMWTFKWRQKENALFWRLFQFHTVSALGAIINYSALLLLVKLFHFWDIGANLVGILMGTFFNYAWNSLWTSKNVKK